MNDRQVIHRLPDGMGPQVNGTLARLFGPELMVALDARRAQQAGGAAAPAPALQEAPAAGGWGAMAEFLSNRGL